MCPDNYVYNLEVEKNHTYFANEVLVHNCHHLGAKTWSNLFNSYPKAWKVGLTATPWRLDGKGLSDFFQVMVQGPTTRWLIDNKYLADYKAFAPVTPDLTGVSTSMGDYSKSELAERMGEAHIIGSAVAEYKKFASNKRAIVFAVSINHSQTIIDDFKSHGIPAEHVDGETPTHERNEIISRFRQGETLVLSNVGLFGEGFDLPDIECVILMRPTKSLSLYRQMVGRGLRPTANKSHAIILDHSGNIMAHGLPCTEIDWTLDGRPKKQSEPSIKICQSCFAAMRSALKSCPQCGHKFHVEQKERKIIKGDGELKEITVDEFKQWTSQKEKKKAYWREAREMNSYAGLKNLCIKYGYKPGYAHVTMNYLKKNPTRKKP
jgi:superfamily II DNA or RNA helicase